MYVRVICLLLCLLLILPAARADLPSPLRSEATSLKRVGEGRLTWLGFGVYRASLWSADGKVPEASPRNALALSLWYERAFKRQQLIDITRNEWERLSLAPAGTRDTWARQLDGIWRDVAKGDNLTALVIPDGETRFYDGTRLLGRITDPGFGPAYVAIWLDERSAVADLRKALIGLGSR
jgi:hypothetical protein